MTAIIVHMSDMKQLDPDTLPNRIREWRLRRGFTLEYVAAQLGTSRMQMSRLETGARETTIGWLERAARVLDVTVADLLAPRHNPMALTPDEVALIDKLRAMPPERANSVQAVADTMASYAPQPMRGPIGPRDQAA